MTSEEKISQVMSYLIELRSFATIIDKNFRKDLYTNDISMCEFLYLLILQQNIDGYTMIELSNIAKVDKSLITRVIKGLENKGYIYRNIDKPNTRKYKIMLTDIGYHKVKIVNNVILRERENFINNYTKDELEIIEKAFSILSDRRLKKGYGDE